MRGFYVHYKGGIYFVHGVAVDKDEGRPDLVIYSSMQSLTASNGEGVEYRYRTVIEFFETIDAMSGAKSFGAHEMPRFQEVAKFNKDGHPMIRTKDGTFVEFVSYYVGERKD